MADRHRQNHCFLPKRQKGFAASADSGFAVGDPQRRGTPERKDGRVPARGPADVARLLGFAARQPLLLRSREGLGTRLHASWHRPPRDGRLWVLSALSLHVGAARAEHHEGREDAGSVHHPRELAARDLLREAPSGVV